jgi:hypothetical protein
VLSCDRRLRFGVGRGCRRFAWPWQILQQFTVPGPPSDFLLPFSMKSGFIAIDFGHELTPANRAG